MNRRVASNELPTNGGWHLRESVCGMVAGTFWKGVASPGDSFNHRDQQAFDIYFGYTGWQRPGQAIEYHGPSEADGGGALYYFDVATSTVDQRTGFW